jgi:hypothetical protein
MANHDEGEVMPDAIWPEGKPIPKFKTDREKAEFWAKYGPSIAERLSLEKAERVPRQHPVVIDRTTDHTRARSRKKASGASR